MSAVSAPTSPGSGPRRAWPAPALLCFTAVVAIGIVVSWPGSARRGSPCFPLCVAVASLGLVFGNVTALALGE